MIQQLLSGVLIIAGMMTLPSQPTLASNSTDGTVSEHEAGKTEHSAQSMLFWTAEEKSAGFSAIGTLFLGQLRLRLFLVAAG